MFQGSQQIEIQRYQCDICNNEIVNVEVDANDPESLRLQDGHLLLQEKGWCVVAAGEVCPKCAEKFDICPARVSGTYVRFETFDDDIGPRFGPFAGVYIRKYQLQVKEMDSDASYHIAAYYVDQCGHWTFTAVGKDLFGMPEDAPATSGILIYSEEDEECQKTSTNM